ncbi:hypothetical protein Tco_1290347 [Tanacetum coccineum]
MIGCKVMRTFASVEIEIMLILGLSCCLSSNSSVRCLDSSSACCLKNFVDSRRMSTLVFLDPESSTQADGAQSSRVPVPLPEDPYEAIRHAYLDGTDTESEPFEDPIDTETLESPLVIAPPIPLSESTSPVLVPILRRTARMAMRVPPAMLSGLSASIEGVAAMSESALRKRFQSSYESSPFVSPRDLPSQKRYRRTSKLVEDSEEDDEEEDEEIEESMDSDSVSEDTKEEGPTAEDEDPGMDDEGRGPRGGVGGCTWRLAAGSSGYGDNCECAFRTWGSESTPESGRPERVSAFRQPTLTTWTDLEDATLAAVETEGFLTGLGAQVEMYDRDIGELFTRSGAVREEIFSQSDVQRENQDLRLQLAEERRARLELDEVVDGMRRGQKPRGDA